VTLVRLAFISSKTFQAFCWINIRLGVDFWSFGCTTECVTRSISPTFCLWRWCLTRYTPICLSVGMVLPSEWPRFHVWKVYASCISLLFSSLCARVLMFRNQEGDAQGKFSVRVYVQADTCDLLFQWKWVLHTTVVPSFKSDDGSHVVACAGATFPDPCEIAAHTHGIGINASNYMLLHRYHEFMFMFTEKNDQVTKWQIWDNMIGIILKVGYFYQENFSMHDSVWMSILPQAKSQNSADVLWPQTQREM